MATNRHLNSSIRSIITIIQILVVLLTLIVVSFVGFTQLVGWLYAIPLTFVLIFAVVNVIWTAMEYTQKFVKSK